MKLTTKEAETVKAALHRGKTNVGQLSRSVVKSLRKKGFAIVIGETLVITKRGEEEADAYRKTVHRPLTVSTGTLKTDDLIDAFVSTLKELNNPRAAKFERSADFLRRKLAIAEEKGNYGKQSYEDVQEETEYFLNEDLFPALESHAGPGLVFGSRPGDGADFGFYPPEFDDQD